MIPTLPSDKSAVSTPTGQSAPTASFTFSQKSASSSLQSSASEEISWSQKIMNFFSACWQWLRRCFCCEDQAEHFPPQSPTNFTTLPDQSHLIYYQGKSPISIKLLEALRDSVQPTDRSKSNPLVHIRDSQTGYFKKFWNYLVLEHEGQVIFQTKIKEMPGAPFTYQLKIQHKEFSEFSLEQYFTRPGQKITAHHAVVVEETNAPNKVSVFELELQDVGTQTPITKQEGENTITIYPPILSRKKQYLITDYTLLNPHLLNFIKTSQLTIDPTN
jgi:hypothetical protein